MQSLPYQGVEPGQSGHFACRITRHQLQGYLNLYNSYTGMFMGTIGSISSNGIMLISPLPVMLDAEYDMQLRLPTAGENVQVVEFRAVSRWCRPDLTPGHYDSGFSIISETQIFADLANALQRYFSFVHPVDA